MPKESIDEGRILKRESSYEDHSLCGLAEEREYLSEGISSFSLCDKQLQNLSNLQ